jgi:hypothetical protein
MTAVAAPTTSPVGAAAASTVVSAAASAMVSTAAAVVATTAAPVALNIGLGLFLLGLCMNKNVCISTSSSQFLSLARILINLLKIGAIAHEFAQPW